MLKTTILVVKEIFNKQKGESSMERKIIKSNEDYRDLKTIQSENKLFGWALKSKEKVTNMVGVGEIEEYTEYVFERDESMPNYEKLVDFERQYAELKEKIVALNEELKNKKAINIGEEPVWVKTKSTNLGTINGKSDYTYTKTIYYNNYVPMNKLVVVGLFTPLLPICLLYVIIKCVQKSKAKKLLAKDHEEYVKKLADKNQQISQVEKEISNAENAMNGIIERVNSL